MEIVQASNVHLQKVSVLFDLYRQFYEQPSDPDSAKEFISKRINKNESVIYLAMDENTGDGMGFVQLYPAFSSVSLKRIWILNDLFVGKDYRKQGVAEALIEKSKEFAGETGSKGIILETHLSNVNAQKLYDKTGFKKDEEHYYYFYEV